MEIRMPVPKSTVENSPRKLLRDVVYEKMLAAIHDGTLQAGERLNDDELVPGSASLAPPSARRSRSSSTTASSRWRRTGTPASSTPPSTSSSTATPPRVWVRSSPARAACRARRATPRDETQLLDARADGLPQAATTASSRAVNRPRRVLPSPVRRPPRAGRPPTGAARARPLALTARPSSSDGPARLHDPCARPSTRRDGETARRGRTLQPPAFELESRPSATARA